VLLLRDVTTLRGRADIIIPKTLPRRAEMDSTPHVQASADALARSFRMPHAH